MKIDKPIFIVGSGRSGTTILYNLLSLHPELCWFSNLTDRWPGIPRLSVLHRLLDLPYIGTNLKKNILKRGSKFRIRPAEAGNIFHSYCGFESGKKSTGDDFNKQTAKKFKKIAGAHLQMTGRKRIIIKQTANNQRIRLINRIFPDAYYIHIIRDGRAVANSLFKVKWWNEVDIWWLGCKPAKWLEPGREPIELCALQWKNDVEEILNNKELLGNRYFEIRYEEMVKDVHGSIGAITKFCELGMEDNFVRLLPESLPNMNYKWKKDLTKQQKSVINDSVNEFLFMLGYAE